MTSPWPKVSKLRASRCSNFFYSQGFCNQLHPTGCPFLFRLGSIHSQQRCGLRTDSVGDDRVLFGKQMKDEFKRRRTKKRLPTPQELSEERAARLARWDLTVGLEIHAQLNTDRKLFSHSPTSIDAPPNSNVSFFDLAFPGSQPIFQAAALIPAIRAAVALNCQIERESRFDRKHYFYPDQPAGYQITQYYRPFAKDGHVILYEQDGIEPADKPVTIGIKQIQMEQDTAKSISEPPSTTLVDFNRVGHPLIEIITLPEIHSPETAAACVRKIQSILQSVNAVFTGMEMGGLRADVNVSVSPKGSGTLGQRTEIKNLSSFKAVEQAIIAERDRQIETLEKGDSIAGETRGWVTGATDTTRLRGKEGEVDYRYMPDPDVLPLLIDGGVVDHIQKTLPTLPDETVSDLVRESGLTIKDAKTLLALDDGERLDYFDDVCERMREYFSGQPLSKEMSTLIANWVIHEIGGLLSTNSDSFSSDIIPSKSLAKILMDLHNDRITGRSAKRLLLLIYHGDNRKVDEIIEAEAMVVQHLADAEYEKMAAALVKDHPQTVAQIQKGRLKKLKFFVGQMVRISNGNIIASKAEHALKTVLKL